MLNSACRMLHGACYRYILNAARCMLNLACWIPCAEFRMLHAEFCMLNSACWMLHAECWMMNAEWWMLNAECCMMNAAMLGMRPHAGLSWLSTVGGRGSGPYNSSRAELGTLLYTMEGREGVRERERECNIESVREQESERSEEWMSVYIHCLVCLPAWQPAHLYTCILSLFKSCIFMVIYKLKFKVDFKRQQRGKNYRWATFITTCSERCYLLWVLWVWIVIMI